MKIKQLAADLAHLEGKKSQARIGDIREILAILGSMLLTMDNVEYADTLNELIKSGKRRMKSTK